MPGIVWEPSDMLRGKIPGRIVGLELSEQQARESIDVLKAVAAGLPPQSRKQDEVLSLVTDLEKALDYRGGSFARAKFARGILSLTLDYYEGKGLLSLLPSETSLAVCLQRAIADEKVG